MEIWRMLIDGSCQEKLTHDDYSNWFPHVAPDNKKFIFLSYIEDQKQNHPFGKKISIISFNKIPDKIGTIGKTQGVKASNIPKPKNKIEVISIFLLKICSAISIC